MKNNNVSIEFILSGNGDYIRGVDLTDMNNIPTFYTTKKRGLEKAYKELESVFNENTTYHNAMDFLDARKLSTHSYCAMD